MMNFGYQQHGLESRKIDQWFSIRHAQLLAIHRRLVSEKKMASTDFMSAVKEKFLHCAHRNDRAWSILVQSAVSSVLQSLGISGVVAAAACAIVGEDPPYESDADDLSAYMEVYWQGLLRVDGRTRHAFVRSARDGWRTDAIAAELEVSIDEATSMLATALRAVAQELEASGFELGPGLHRRRRGKPR